MPEADGDGDVVVGIHNEGKAIAPAAIEHRLAGDHGAALKVVAQLRLRQVQIEPHFLFNTLANVQSLMDRDTPRAKLMLERFTDYLCASLGQLRNTDSTLATELAMIRNYLELLQIRMEERLRFEIDASDEALAATLPTLLLQLWLKIPSITGWNPRSRAAGCAFARASGQSQLEVARQRARRLSPGDVRELG